MELTGVCKLLYGGEEKLDRNNVSINKSLVIMSEECIQAKPTPFSFRIPSSSEKYS